MRKIQLILGSFAILATCGVSSAATITLTPQTIDPQVGSFSSSLSFAQFDSSLGTLTGVHITTSANFSVNFTVANPVGNGAAVYSEADGFGAVDVTGPAGLDISLGGATAPQNGSLADGASITYSSQPASDNEFADVFDFADFTGNGSSLVRLDFAAEGFGAEGTGTANLLYSAIGSTGGTADIVYTYTPTTSPATPEPGTWLLMGTSLVGLFAARKRFSL